MANIFSTQQRVAILLKYPSGSEYIYKDYANEEQLNKYLPLLKQRFLRNREYRIARIKITTEEVVENEHKKIQQIPGIQSGKSNRWEKTTK